MANQGNMALGLALLLAWTPVVAVLFRVIGKRNATLVAVIGGYLLLPPTMIRYPLGLHTREFGKIGAIGLALGVAMVVWDWRRLIRFRPHPLDVPALGMFAWGLLEALVGEYHEYEMGSSILGQRLWWLSPYMAARLYFADTEGARRIAVAVVVASLGLFPVVLFETSMGPSWYLRTLCYRLPAHDGMTERLGRWRPEAFFSHGIEMGSWLGIATVMAFWLWRGRVWRPAWGPAWGPSLVLAVTTVMTVTVYGYINLALGLAVVAITLGLRTRTAIVALALLTPLYIGVRVSGVWDGRWLVNQAERMGRKSTVSSRLMTETRMIDAVLEHNPAFGHGRPLGVSWAEKEEPFEPAAYGGWLVFFWAGGLVGVSVWLVALQGFPIGLALMHPRERPDRDQVGTPVWGLAVFLALGMFDCLHNNPSYTPMALAAGSIVGLTLGGRSARKWTPAPRGVPEAGKTSRGAERTRKPVVMVERHLARDSARLAAVLAILAIPEILGHLTGKATGPVPARAVISVLPPSRPPPQTEINNTSAMQNPVK